MQKENYKKYILTFLVTTGVFCLILAIGNIYPFGELAYLRGDMTNQYLDFMQDIINHLRNHNFSLFFSADISMGYDYLPFFMYYLSSPITLLALFIASFFKNTNIILLATLLTIFKLSLAGATMTYYLVNHYKKYDKFMLAISVCYALCGFNLEYNQSLMWLDGIILLPIIIKLVDDVLQNKNKKYFVLSISLLMFSNFYTGYMVILFSGLYYIYQYYLISENFKFNKLIINLLKYIGLVALGCCLIGAFLIPTMQSILSNRAGTDFSSLSSNTISSLENLKSILQFYIGQSNFFVINDYPLLYCGLLNVFLFIIYFTNKNISIKNKITYLVVIVLLASGLLIPFIDKAWHLFQNPLGFPHRYIFCIIFFMLIVSYESYACLQKKNKIILPLAIALILILFLGEFYKYVAYINKYLLVNLLFIFAYGFLLYKGNKRIISFILIFEIFINGIIVLNEDNSLYFAYDKHKNYIDKISNSMPDKIDNYRLEKTCLRPKRDSNFNNEAMFFNYNGICSYSSIYNQNNIDALTKLGYEKWTFSINYSNINPFIDNLLGVKYIIHKSELPFKKIKDNTYEYNCPNNIIFKSNIDINTELTQNVIENQNNLSQLLFNKDILSEIGYSLDNFYNLYKVDYKGDIIFDKDDFNDAGYMNIYPEKGNEGKLLFLYFKNPKFDNSTEITYTDVAKYIWAGRNDMLIYLGEVIDGEPILYNQFSTRTQMKDLELYIMDSKDLNQFAHICNNDYKINKNTIYTNSKENEFIYLSIANTDALKIKLNSKVIEPQIWLDNFIKIPLAKGNNTIEISYNFAKLYAGISVSILGIATYIVLFKKKMI